MVTRVRLQVAEPRQLELSMTVSLLASKTEAAANWHEQMAQALRAQARELKATADVTSSLVEAAIKEQHRTAAA